MKIIIVALLLLLISPSYAISDSISKMVTHENAEFSIMKRNYGFDVNIALEVKNSLPINIPISNIEYSITDSTGKILSEGTIDSLQVNMLSNTWIQETVKLNTEHSLEEMMNEKITYTVKAKIFYFYTYSYKQTSTLQSNLDYINYLQSK